MPWRRYIKYLHKVIFPWSPRHCEAIYSANREKQQHKNVSKKLTGQGDEHISDMAGNRYPGWDLTVNYNTRA